MRVIRKFNYNMTFCFGDSKQLREGVEPDRGPAGDHVDKQTEKGTKESGNCIIILTVIVRIVLRTCNLGM